MLNKPPPQICILIKSWDIVRHFQVWKALVYAHCNNKKLAGLHTTSFVLLELNLMTLCYNGRESLPKTWNLFGKERWCRSTSKFSSCYTLGALMGDLTLVVEKCVGMCVCVCVCVCYLLSCVWLVVTPWTVTCQAPLSMKFSRKTTGVVCYFLLQGIFLTQESNLGLLHCR